VQGCRRLGAAECGSQCTLRVRCHAKNSNLLWHSVNFYFGIMHLITFLSCIKTLCFLTYLKIKTVSTRFSRRKVLQDALQFFLHLFFYTLFRKRAVSGNNGKRQKVDFSSENARRAKIETTGKIAV
jgi:hypothetical protein